MVREGVTIHEQRADARTQGGERTHGTEQHQRPGDLSGAVRRRHRAATTPGTASPNGRRGHGFVGVQVPTWDGRLFDLKKAAASKDLLRRAEGHRQEERRRRSPSSRPISRASCVATHPAYDEQFDGFAPKEMRGNPKKRQAWAVDQVMLAAKASKQSRPRRPASPSPARSPGRSSIPSRSGRPAWSRPPSMSSRGAGSRSSTPMTRSASISATRSIPARISMTAPPSRCSSTR